MWQQEFIWFFAIFYQEFRKNNPIAFEVLMVLAIANLFGFYNPKQLADYLSDSILKKNKDYINCSMIHKIIKGIPRLPTYVSKLAIMLTYTRLATDEAIKILKQDPALIYS